MAKKRGKEQHKLGKIIEKIFHNFIKSILDGVYDWWNEKIYHLKKKAIMLYYVLTFFFLGLILLAFSLVFLISEYAKISLGWSFLLVGIALTLLHLIFISKIMKK